LVDNITDTVKLDAIQQATIAAAGIDTTRGDVLTVKSIPFDRSFYADQEAAMDETQQREFYLKLAQWGAVVLVLIVLFFVVRRLQRSLRVRQIESIKELDPRIASLGDLSRLTAENAELGDGKALDLRAIGPPTFDADQQAAAEKAQMLRQLQLMAKNRPETLAQIIQFWLAEEEAV
jgi:flagellar M-ring protein FliF